MTYQIRTVLILLTSGWLAGAPLHGQAAIMMRDSADTVHLSTPRPGTRQKPMDTIPTELSGFVHSDSDPGIGIAGASVGCPRLDGNLKEETDTFSDSAYNVRTDTDGKFKIEIHGWKFDKRHGIAHIIWPNGADCIDLLVAKNGYTSMSRFIISTPMQFSLQKKK